MVQIRRSTIIDAPVDAVWAILRDFNGHDQWHPAIAASAIEAGEPADTVGAVRAFRLADGGALREQLLELSDRHRRLTYCLLESPLPLMGYVATIRLLPVTDTDATFWEWRCEFQPPANRSAELVKLVAENIYEAGFSAIKRQFGGKPPAPTRLATALPPSTRLATAPPPLTPPRREGGSNVLGSPAPLWGRVRSVGGSEQAVSRQIGNDRTQAIVIDRYGGPDVMQMREIVLAPVAPGEVRVRHTAIGVNYIDVYCRTGYFNLLQPPGVLGMEAAGVVEAVGAGVTGLSVGDRVAYACPPVGAYAERRNMAPDLLVRLSPDIPDDIAAAGLLKGVTASFLLHDVCAVRAGQIVLIHAAAGGVGQLLVQWAHHLGARVIATVSTDEKARLVEKLGADHVIVYSREGFAEEVMHLTDGQGANVVYDAVGKDTFGSSIAALAVRGHLISFGQASGPVGDWDIGRFSSKSITVSRPNYAHYTDTANLLAPHVERFFQALRSGALRVQPPTRYSLEDASKAHRDLESRRTTGPLILIP